MLAEPALLVSNMPEPPDPKKATAASGCSPDLCDLTVTYTKTRVSSNLPQQSCLGQRLIEAQALTSVWMRRRKQEALQGLLLKVDCTIVMCMSTSACWASALQSAVRAQQGESCCLLDCSSISGCTTSSLHSVPAPLSPVYDDQEMMKGRSEVAFEALGRISLD